MVLAFASFLACLLVTALALLACRSLPKQAEAKIPERALLVRLAPIRSAPAVELRSGPSQVLGPDRLVVPRLPFAGTQRSVAR